MIGMLLHIVRPSPQVCMVLRYVADEIAVYSDDIAVSPGMIGVLSERKAPGAAILQVESLRGTCQLSTGLASSRHATSAGPDVRLGRRLTFWR